MISEVLARNIVGNECMNFANIDTAAMKEAAKASILANEPLWFDEHVYTIIVHRRHVPADILDLFQQEATVLPAWYPGAMGIQSAIHPA